ncbi:MAG: rRNA pseudouridine synthase [Clostridiales bacterium]|jgi:16S rRNA pseudouridine516 synthase|nr:rRNA pseudouridine synthase [Clostridiales bacterium]
MGLERLDKIIASQGEYSRRQAKRLARESLIAVNGKTVKDISFKADTKADIITVCGKELVYKEYVYIMMNKPKGVLSTCRDKKAKTVIDLLPQELRRKKLFPAGRLDKDTTGFVLITDDGDFAHRILSPTSRIMKTYETLLSKRLTSEDIDAFHRGITLEDGTKCQPANVIPLEGTRVVIKICEGRYHQIKRMVAACGNEVLELKRTAIGSLTLDSSLAPGECRELTEAQVDKILI